MSHFLLAIIRTYWAVWPRHRNRGCIYRESCSHHVYRLTSERGFTAGLRSLRHRVRTCRPGYTVSSDAIGIGLLLSDGSFLPGHLVSDAVLSPIQLTISDLERRLTYDNRNG
jgi:putative component of membrane protein insertase Oxa1/YidC/SpoIIIJ protein YidD